MRQNIDFADRYEPATLLLLWKKGRLIQLNGGGRLYHAFYEIMKPILRPEDNEIYSSVRRRGSDEACWHIGLRFALWRMREDKHPKDGRVRRLGRGLYEMTDQGRNWLESYLYDSAAPLDWLELEIEELKDGSELHNYHHPMNGDVVISFGASYR